MKALSTVLILVSLTAAPAALASDARLPSSWVTLPEDAPATRGFVLTESTTPDDGAGKAVEHVLDLNAKALDQLNAPEMDASSSGKPADWVPWHLEYFTTDLSVSASGLLGVLTAKGTPAVQVFWRHQGQKPDGNRGEDSSAENAPAPTTLVFRDGATASDISDQMEPAVKAVLATGQVEDEAAFRRNLRSAARDFQAMASSLSADTGSQWWVSRLRLDLVVEGNGSVGFFTKVGAEVRLRFEWHRIKRNAATPPAPGHLTTRGSTLANSLRELVGAVGSDLSSVAPEALANEGFQAAFFRVGIGATASGTVGIAKGSASVLGHVYFNRDVKKPQVYPPAPSRGADRSKPIHLIERSPSPAHLAFARAHAVRVAMARDDDTADFEIDRDSFRSGLGKSFGIARFFADHGRTEGSNAWKIHTMYTDFDMSLVGDVGLAKLGGAFSTEVVFYNQNF